MRTTLLIAAAGFALTAACTGSSTHSKAEPTPTEINPCGGASPAPGCLPTDPTPAPRVPYPSDASKIPPLPDYPLFANEIKRVTNNSDPSVRTLTMTVVIPKGKVIETDLVCQGAGNVAITTQPDSQGDQKINCDSADVPSQFGVFASDKETADKTYVITVKADGPIRFLAAACAR